MKSRYLLTGLILTVSLVAGIFILRKMFPTQAITHSASADSKSKGLANAPVQIIEYSDFQCPACRVAEPVVRELMTAYPEKIHFVYRHFPLSSHVWSPLAHQSAECAANYGKFWEFHDSLYRDQQVWSVSANPVEFFFKYAGELGFDLDAFAGCVQDKKTSLKVLDEKASGEALKVRSTPTFFINGERFAGALDLRMKGEPLIRQILGLPAKTETAPVEDPAPAADEPLMTPKVL